MKKRRILFQIETCPFCKNAREALDDANVKYEIHNIDPSDRSIVQLLSGQPSVPILVDVVGCEEQDDDIIEEIPNLR